MTTPSCLRARPKSDTDTIPSPSWSNRVKTVRSGSNSLLSCMPLAMISMARRLTCECTSSVRSDATTEGGSGCRCSAASSHHGCFMISSRVMRSSMSLVIIDTTRSRPDGEM